MNILNSIRTNIFSSLDRVKGMEELYNNKQSQNTQEPFLYSLYNFVLGLDDEYDEYDEYLKENKSPKAYNSDNTIFYQKTFLLGIILLLNEDPEEETSFRETFSLKRILTNSLLKKKLEKLRNNKDKNPDLTKKLQDLVSEEEKLSLLLKINLIIRNFFQKKIIEELEQNLENISIINEICNDRNNDQKIKNSLSPISISMIQTMGQSENTNLKEKQKFLLEISLKYKKELMEKIKNAIEIYEEKISIEKQKKKIRLQEIENVTNQEKINRLNHELKKLEKKTFKSISLENQELNKNILKKMDEASIVTFCKKMDEASIVTFCKEMDEASIVTFCKKMDDNKKTKKIISFSKNLSSNSMFYIYTENFKRNKSNFVTAIMACRSNNSPKGLVTRIKDRADKIIDLLILKCNYELICESILFDFDLAPYLMEREQLFSDKNKQKTSQNNADNIHPNSKNFKPSSHKPIEEYLIFPDIEESLRGLNGPKNLTETVNNIYFCLKGFESNYIPLFLYNSYHDFYQKYPPFFKKNHWNVSQSIFFIKFSNDFFKENWNLYDSFPCTEKIQTFFLYEYSIKILEENYPTLSRISGPLKKLKKLIVDFASKDIISGQTVKENAADSPEHNSEGNKTLFINDFPQFFTTETKSLIIKHRNDDVITSYEEFILLPRYKNSTHDQIKQEISDKCRSIKEFASRIEAIEIYKKRINYLSNSKGINYLSNPKDSFSLERFDSISFKMNNTVLKERDKHLKALDSFTGLATEELEKSGPDFDLYSPTDRKIIKQLNRYLSFNFKKKTQEIVRDALISIYPIQRTHSL